MYGCLSFLIFLIAVVALIVALQARSRLKLAERELAFLRQRLRETGLLEVEQAVPQPQPVAYAPPQPVADPHQPLVVEPVPEYTQPEPVPAFHQPEPPPPPPPPPATTPTQPQAPPTPSRPFDWESLVGVKLFSWIAGIALVLAAVFFLKYSVEHGWLSPAVRAAIGIATGIAMIAICEMRVARNYRVTANSMHGAAIAILYATLFAMHALWQIVSPATAFFLMLLVTAAAVWLSIRRDSVFIALLGLLGGFATPALLSTGENRPIVLFSYLLLLNLGLAWVAWWRGWPALSALSVILTAIYQWGWIGKFLTAAQLPLAAGIFIAFAIVSTFGLWTWRRDGETDRTAFQRIGTIGATLPLLFALFTAASPVYGARFNTLFGFLLLIAAGLTIIAIRLGTNWLHQLGGLAVLMTFAVWASISYTSTAWPVILAWVAAFITLYLAAATKLGPRGSEAGSLLFFMFAALAALEPAAQRPELLFGVALLLLGVTAYCATRWSAARLHWIAAILTFVGLAIWTGNHLGESNLASGLMLFSAYSFVALAASLFANARGVMRIPPHFALLSWLLLFFVASQRSLAIPPTLLLAALTAILLAVAFTAMFLRKRLLLAGTVAGAQITLIILATVTTSSPWTETALIAAVIVASISFVCYLIDHSFIAAVPVGVVGAHIVAMVVGSHAGTSTTALGAAHLILIVLLLATSWLSGTFALVILEAAVVAIAVALVSSRNPAEVLAVAATLYAPFILFPILLGARARRSSEPYLAAVLASAAFFFVARHAIEQTDGVRFIGVLPLLQAGLMLLLLRTLLRIEPKGERLLSRLALTGGAALAFFTVAIPLQVDREWVTIAWALEVAALIWLFRRVPYSGLLAWAGGLAIIVFIRLALNPSVFSYHAASNTPIINWYLYTWLVPAIAFFVAARLLPHERTLFRSLLNAGATVLLFLLLNIEIADFYSTGSALTFNFFSSSLAQELTYTLGWALFAIAMLIAGIVMQVRSARIAALILLIVTVLKCFLHDLARLGGLYRVGSLIGLAASLVLVGVLLQKFVLMRRPAATAAE